MGFVPELVYRLFGLYNTLLPLYTYTEREKEHKPI